MEQYSAQIAGGAGCAPPPDKPYYFALSRTTDRVLQILLRGDLARLRAETVAGQLGMSCTTLRWTSGSTQLAWGNGFTTH